MIVTGIVVLVLLMIVLYLGAGFEVLPQGEVWIIERMGKYSRTAHAGPTIILPIIEKVRRKMSTKDEILDIPHQEVITKDNVIIDVSAVAFIKVINPKDAFYNIGNYEKAIMSLIKTSLRSIVGNMPLDDALSGRDKIKKELKDGIANDIKKWGINVKTVEIQDITPSASMQKAMEKQATAERERRAMEIKAEGEHEVSILHAKSQEILAASAAESIKCISKVLPEGSELPIHFLLGEKYIDSIHKLSSSQNSKFVVYPADLQKTLGSMVDKFSK